MGFLKSCVSIVGVIILTWLFLSFSCWGGGCMKNSNKWVFYKG
jgi:hypothetical protein